MSCLELLTGALKAAADWQNRTHSLACLQTGESIINRVSCAGVHGPPQPQAPVSSLCEDRLAVAERRWQIWRGRAGKLSCARYGVGPSGGFCLTKGHTKVCGALTVCAVCWLHPCSQSCVSTGGGELTLLTYTRRWGGTTSWARGWRMSSPFSLKTAA